MDKKTIVIIVPIIMVLLMATTIHGDTVWDYLTKGLADTLYCSIGGSCNMTELTVQNLTVTGTHFNVTVENYNVTGELTVSGNVSADYYCDDTGCYSIANFLSSNSTADYSDDFVNITGDTMTGNLSIELATGAALIYLESEMNKNATLRFAEGSTFGFKFVYDGEGLNNFFFETVNTTGNFARWRIPRDERGIYFYDDLDMDKQNITNADCIQLRDGWLCSSVGGGITLEENNSLVNYIKWVNQTLNNSLLNYIDINNGSVEALMLSIDAAQNLSRVTNNNTQDAYWLNNNATRDTQLDFYNTTMTTYVDASGGFTNGTDITVGELNVTKNIRVAGNITHQSNHTFGIFNNGSCILIGDLALVGNCCSADC